MTKDATWSSLADRSTLTFTVYSFQMCTDFRNSFTSWFTRKFSTYTPQISASAAIRCYTTLSKSKIQKKCYWFWQHPQETVDMFPRTLWGLDLTCNSSSTDCLKTAHTDWLTNILKFVRRRLEWTAEPYSVEHCCIVAFFSPWLSSHRLCSF